MTVMLNKQTIFPDSDQLRSIPKLTNTLCVNGSVVYSSSEQGRGKSQHYIGDTFILSAGEGRLDKDAMCHHTQEDFIKFHFRLSGGRAKHVFNGFGEIDCDQPQVIVLSGPPDMIKIDLGLADCQGAAVNLFVLRDFFIASMGLDADTLPNVLRKIVYPEQMRFALHCMPLTPGFVFAARAILAAPYETLLGDLYSQAKAMELMCLVINQMKFDEQRGVSKAALPARKVKRLHEVRDLLSQHYADHITLDKLAKQVGLGKTTLTSGFLKLFGLSIFDYIQQERMSRAYELLQSREHSVIEVAQAVGYNHHSNFSNAFRHYYGCTPQAIATQ